MLINVTDGQLFLQHQLQLEEERKLSQLQQRYKYRPRGAMPIYREILYFLHVIRRFGALLKEMAFNAIIKCGLPFTDFQEPRHCSTELCADLLYQNFCPNRK
jgi:hypothetical protein